MTSSARHSRTGTTGCGMTFPTFDVEVSCNTRTCRENSHLSLSSCLAEARQRFRIGVAAAASLTHVPFLRQALPFWQQGVLQTR